MRMSASRRLATLTALCLVAGCGSPTDNPSPAEAAPSTLSSAAVASVDLGPFQTSAGTGLPANDISGLNCTVDGRRMAKWTATLADGSKAVLDAQLPPAGSLKSVWQVAPFGLGWVVALVPADVDDLDVATNLSSDVIHSYSVAADFLSGVDVTCLAIRYDTAADAAEVKGLVWRTSGGVFRRDTGDVVPSVDVTAGDDRVSLYSDKSLDLFGVITASGSATSYHPSKSTDPFPCVLFSTVRQTSGNWRTFFVGVLPAGSNNVKMTFLATATGPSLQTAKASSGELFFVAMAETAAQAGELFESFTYSNAQGAVVTPTWN